MQLPHPQASPAFHLSPPRRLGHQQTLSPAYPSLGRRPPVARAAPAARCRRRRRHQLGGAGGSAPAGGWQGRDASHKVSTSVGGPAAPAMRLLCCIKPACGCPACLPAHLHAPACSCIAEAVLQLHCRIAQHEALLGAAAVGDRQLVRLAGSLQPARGAGQRGGSQNDRMQRW